MSTLSSLDGRRSRCFDPTTIHEDCEEIRHELLEAIEVTKENIAYAEERGDMEVAEEDGASLPIIEEALIHLRSLVDCVEAGME